MAKKSGPVVLKSSRWRAVVGDPNDPDNEAAWTELEVQGRSADEVRAEALFRRNKGWGSITDSPLTWQHAQLWAALVRTRQLGADTSFDTFRAGLVEWEVLDDEDDDEAPTQPAPEAG